MLIRFSSNKYYETKISQHENEMLDICINSLHRRTGYKPTVYTPFLNRHTLLLFIYFLFLSIITLFIYLFIVPV